MEWGLLGFLLKGCLGVDEPRWDSWRWDSWDPEDTWDRRDTDFNEVYTGPTLFDTIGYNCDSAGWFYDLYSIGWMGGAELYIYQTDAEDPWDEYHPFPAESYDYDPNGAWDNYYMELDYVDSFTDVVEGSTTFYACDDSVAATLTWVIIVYDTAGQQADCVTWGHSPGFGVGDGCTTI